MLHSIAKCGTTEETKLDIFDCRAISSAHANRFHGGGYENVDHYTNCELIFLDIGNIHAVSTCFNKMVEISSKPENFNSINKYGPKVEESGYMQMISGILIGANKMVNSMLVKKRNVIVHCSDGWDRTSQISTLT